MYRSAEGDFIIRKIGRKEVLCIILTIFFLHLFLISIFFSVDELGLELEEEPAPRKTRIDQKQKNAAAKPEVRAEVKAEAKVESKVELKTKTKSKAEPSNPPARLSAKERLGTSVAPKTEQPKEKVLLSLGVFKFMLLYLILLLLVSFLD